MEQIGIMGVGVLGGALARYFTLKGHVPFLYDPVKKIGSLEEINKASLIFICVPTPYHGKNGGFDLSFVHDACKNVQGSKTLVIKSTIIPGTTDDLQRQYPPHRFMYNPEFLRETKAWEDMLHPDRQIVGVTEQSKDFGETVLYLLPQAPFERIVKAKEAETIKYTGNTFLALKVTFANQIYDICEKAGVDYEVVRECVGADSRIGPSHLNVHHRAYRGYGGKCLPKDMRAFIQLAKKLGVDPKLLEAAELVNNQLMELQHIEDPEKMPS